MRQTKEERIIDNSEEIIAELNRVYFQGICIDEYKKLLNEYKKLFKRYEKTIKLSDYIGQSIFQEKENLSNTLEYTINKARKKLFENVEEHKKTKSVFLSYREKMIQYEKSLDSLVYEKDLIKKQLDDYTKRYGEISHKFTDDKFDNVMCQNIKLEKLLSIILGNRSENFIFLKLKLKDIEEIIDLISSQSSINSFISQVYKFIESVINKESIVYHEDNGIFFTILVNEDMSNTMQIIEKLNSKRDIYNHKIEFYVSVVEFSSNKNYTVRDYISISNEALRKSIKKEEVTIIRKDIK